MNALQFWRSFLNVEKYRTIDEATKHFLCLLQINHLKCTGNDMYHLLTYFKHSTSSPFYLVYLQMSFGWQSKHLFPPNGKISPRCVRAPLTVEDSWSHSDTPHSVGLLWTGDQPVAETFTWQYITLLRERHPWPRRDSNPHPSKRTAEDQRQ